MSETLKIAAILVADVVGYSWLARRKTSYQSCLTVNRTVCE